MNRESVRRSPTTRQLTDHPLVIGDLPSDNGRPQVRVVIEGRPIFVISYLAWPIPIFFLSSLGQAVDKFLNSFPLTGYYDRRAVWQGMYSSGSSLRIQEPVILREPQIKG